MSKHPRLRIRASRQAAIKQAKAERTFPVFYRTQDSRIETPAEFLPLEACRDLKARGVGDFINRGKAFRRYDCSGDGDRGNYKPSARQGESLNINETMMDRFVNGDGYAIEAVEAWA